MYENTKNDCIFSGIKNIQIYECTVDNFCQRAWGVGEGHIEFVNFEKHLFPNAISQSFIDNTK